MTGFICCYVDWYIHQYAWSPTVESITYQTTMRIFVCAAFLRSTDMSAEAIAHRLDHSTRTVVNRITFQSGYNSWLAAPRGSHGNTGAPVRVRKSACSPWPLNATSMGPPNLRKDSSTQCSSIAHNAHVICLVIVLVCFRTVLQDGLSSMDSSAPASTLGTLSTFTIIPTMSPRSYLTPSLQPLLFSIHAAACAYAVGWYVL